MTARDWMLDLGLKVPDMIAGFAGGAVNAIVFKRADIWSVCGSVVVGALTANYLGEAMARQFGISQSTCAFLVGLGGMVLVQGLVSSIKNWRPPGMQGGG